MKLIAAKPEPADRSPDELDGLLRAYFCSEMPEPWPALNPPVPAPRTESSWWTKSRSRLALAASVAVLLLASWWLAGQPGSQTSPANIVTPGAGTANDPLTKG